MYESVINHQPFLFHACWLIFLLFVPSLLSFCFVFSPFPRFPDFWGRFFYSRCAWMLLWRYLSTMSLEELVIVPSTVLCDRFVCLKPIWCVILRKDARLWNIVNAVAQTMQRTPLPLSDRPHPSAFVRYFSNVRRRWLRRSMVWRSS